MRSTLPRRYADVVRMGRHGRAAVYGATDTIAGLEVAIKLGTGDAGSQEDLKREFRLLARLRHPSIVRGLGFGWTADGLPYLVTEHAGSIGFPEFARQQPETDLSQCVRQIILALDALHRLGFVHGDVKPSHIQVRPGRVPRAILLDLGLARRFGPVQQLTGTPGFLAPEMLRFEDVDPRSDWFSLGMTLLHCILESVPRALRDTELAVRSRSRFREAVQRVLPRVPAKLRPLLSALLEPALELRPQRGEDLIRLLGGRRTRTERALQEAPPVFGFTRKRGNRHRLLDLLTEMPAGALQALCLGERQADLPMIEEFAVEAAVEGTNVLRVSARRGRLRMEDLQSELLGHLPSSISLVAGSMPSGLLQPRHPSVLHQALARLQKALKQPVLLILEGLLEPALIDSLQCSIRLQMESLRMAAALSRKVEAAPILILTQDPSFAQSPRFRRRDLDTVPGMGWPARVPLPLAQNVLDAIQSGQTTEQARARMSLVRSLLDRGELLAARRLLEARPCVLQAELLLLEGKPREALSAAHAALVQAKEGTPAETIAARLVFGRIAAALGHHDAAFEAFEAALSEAGRSSAERLRCLRHLVAQAAGPAFRRDRLEVATAWAEQLLLGLQGGLEPLEKARAHFALARWFSRRHSPAKSRLHALKALSSFIRQGARLDNAACRDFLASPVPTRRMAPPRSQARSS